MIGHDQYVVASIVESKTKPTMDQLLAIDETLKKVLEDKTDKRSNNENGPEGEDEKDFEKDSADNPQQLIKYLRAVQPVPKDLRFPTCKAVDMEGMPRLKREIGSIESDGVYSGRRFRKTAGGWSMIARKLRIGSTSRNLPRNLRFFSASERTWPASAYRVNNSSCESTDLTRVSFQIRFIAVQMQVDETDAIFLHVLNDFELIVRNRDSNGL